MMWKAYSKKAAILYEDKTRLREYRIKCKKRRKDNLIKSKKILDDAGIKYVQKTEWHYVIGNIDFYPSTGRYIGEQNGRGIFNLLKILLK
jgi:hypothetical protein